MARQVTELTSTVNQLKKELREVTEKLIKKRKAEQDLQHLEEKKAKVVKDDSAKTQKSPCVFEPPNSSLSSRSPPPARTLTTSPHALELALQLYLRDTERDIEEKKRDLLRQQIEGLQKRRDHLASLLHPSTPHSIV